MKAVYKTLPPKSDNRNIAASKSLSVPYLGRTNISGKNKRDKYISNDYIGYILYNKNQSEKKEDLDAIKIYNSEGFNDGHSASYSSVNFMGRNEPVQIYKNGGERKYSIKMSLIASVDITHAIIPGVNNGLSMPVMQDTKNMERDAMSIVDIDFIARTMLSWTYSEYKNQYGAPKRVWLTYGNIVSKLPCAVLDVKRDIPKDTPWEKYGDGSYDFLPHIQVVTIDLVVCPESLYMVPGASDIATRDIRNSGSANGKYGNPKDDFSLNTDESVYQPILSYLSNINPNVNIESLANILKSQANSYSLSTLSDYAYTNNVAAFKFELNRVINNSKNLQFANSKFGRDTTLFDKNIQADSTLMNSIEDSLPINSSLIRL